MPNISYTYTLTNGTTADASQVQANFDTAKAAINGGLDAVNLAAATASNLGLTRGAVGGRGKSIIATTESRTSVAYGTMPTPDTVTVTLPTDGLIAIAYTGVFKSTAASNARAAIFIGGTQVKASADADSSGAAGFTAAASGPSVNADYPLSSYSAGLICGIEGGSYTGDVTTGQVVGVMSRASNAAGGLEFAGGTTATSPGGYGGPCYVFAAAGSYAVSIQYKCATGSETVTAKNRKLWVWSMGFD